MGQELTTADNRPGVRPAFRSAAWPSPF